MVVVKCVLAEGVARALGVKFALRAMVGLRVPDVRLRECELGCVCSASSRCFLG